MAMDKQAKVRAEVKEFFKEVQAKMKVAFGKAWEFLYPFIKLFMSKAGLVLATSAITAVKAVAETMKEADGDAKRKAAFESIKNDMEAQGIAIGASCIYAAIEAAVQKIKADDTGN